MVSPFYQKIRQSLADQTLQTALDNNAERRNRARRTVYQTLPEDLQAMRQKAQAIRAEVIQNLDRYLNEFIANAQKNGFIVHRADTAPEAVEIILEICGEHNARRIAKSKSMVSEEIELNPALEKAGYEVVETDLGEYIVQLRGEHPAHIITPAVHLTRQQVGELFHEKFGLPLTDDVPSMTATARQILREVFLTADIGLSGVNFGVADNGVICIVTNEGNGRMVTTLPPVHIALMGIERIVPKLDDLALMLYLLPRSATGQKLSVYTNLIRSPTLDGDGCRERHIVLVDNGRSALRHTPLKEALYCIRCGACFNACPVFREIGGHSYVSTAGKHTPYGGPIGSVISAGLFGYQEYGHLARASSLCGACKEACPVDIDLPKLLLRVRAGNIKSFANSTQEKPNAPNYLNLGLKLFTLIATHPPLFHSAQRIAALGIRILAPSQDFLKLPKLSSWGVSKDFPRPALRSFHDVWNQINQEISTTSEGPPSSLPPPVETEMIDSKTSQSLTEWFEKELIALGGTFIECHHTDLPQRVLDVLKENQIHKVQAWSPTCLPDHLLPFLEESGIQVTIQSDPDLRAGITGVECAIAESGTLVLSGDAERPLTASLLPEIHLAILHSSDILPYLPQALKQQEKVHAPVTVLVSGPSRTADIEMTLTIGVHGPKKLIVFCLVEG